MSLSSEEPAAERMRVADDDWETGDASAGVQGGDSDDERHAGVENLNRNNGFECFIHGAVTTRRRRLPPNSVRTPGVKSITEPPNS